MPNDISTSLMFFDPVTTAATLSDLRFPATVDGWRTAQQYTAAYMSSGDVSDSLIVQPCMVAVESMAELVDSSLAVLRALDGVRLGSCERSCRFAASVARLAAATRAHQSSLPDG